MGNKQGKHGHGGKGKAKVEEKKVAAAPVAPAAGAASGPPPAAEEDGPESLAFERYMNELQKTKVFTDGKFEDHYRVIKDLGQPGGYGRAQEVEEIKTGERRAVKIISKRPFRKNPEKLHMFVQEMLLITTLKHPNIVHGFDAFEDKMYIYLVMELCSGGELYDKLKEHEENNTTYTEAEAADLIRQIASGLQTMHAQGVAHCDLKPDNFLFSTKAKDAQIKIIDFNLARYTTRLKYFKNVRGTKFYMAPEVYEHHYTYHCDMWSLGIIIYLLLFGTPPFYAETDEKIKRKVLAGFKPQIREGYGAWFPASVPVSEAAMDIISKLLCDQDNRLTATEVLEHPWIQGHSESTVPVPTTILNGLGTFLGSCKLKPTLLFILSTWLPQAELHDLQSSFRAMDVDHNGFVTLEEIKTYLHDHPELHQDAKQLLLSADVNADGQLCYTELVMASVQKKLMAKEERLWRVFCELDTDSDGSVTLEEMISLLQTAGMEVSREELAKWMSEIDENHDGKIDYDEFLHIFFEDHHAGTEKTFNFEKEAQANRREAARAASGEPEKEQ